MAFYKRKMDIPYDLGMSDLVLVQYTEGGNLYLVNNPTNITVSYNDYIAVSHMKEEGEKTMPYSVCQVLAFTGDSFKAVMEYMGLNLDSPVFEGIKPRYHEEAVVKNLVRENSGKGAEAISSDGKKSSEKGLGKDSNGEREDNPEEKDNQDEAEAFEEEKEYPNGGDDEEEYEPREAGNGYNGNDKAFKGYKPKKEKKKTAQELIQEGKIFSFIRKGH